MWKRPALWAVLSALTLCPRAASAGDVGETVEFARPVLSFFVHGTELPGDVLYDTGESRFIPGNWDTVIFQGLSPDADVAFEAARKDAAGVWTPWLRATVKRHAKGRFWGKATFATKEPGAVRVRAVSVGLPLPHDVDVYGVDVFASEGQSAGATAEAPARGLPAGRPELTDRAGWSAKPPKQPFEADEPKKLTVHHTSGPQPMTLADATKEVQFIQDFHQNGRGWNDIAYHFLIDGQGNIFEGRPLGTLGAHTLRANTNNVGVALLGTHHAPDFHPFTAGKRASFVRLARWLSQGWGVPASTLKGHRDYKSTDCPGDMIYAELAALKKEIDAPAPKVPVWVVARPAWDGAASAP